MIFSSECIMAKTMNKRSGHKRSGRKHSRRAAKKERKGTRGYRKGSKSKTMKGKKDFTTKKTSKVFNRRRHYQRHAKGSRVIRRPYAKKGGATTHNKHTDSVHHGSKPSEVSHKETLIADPNSTKVWAEGAGHSPGSVSGLGYASGVGKACIEQGGTTHCYSNA